MSEFITIESIRLALLDTDPEDNPVVMDLFFADDDITAAIERCARAYNELPPYVDRLTSPEKMPHAEFFIHGVLHQLYLAQLAKTQRNRVEYTAGNMVADPERALVDFLSKAVASHRDLFREGAKAFKVDINVRRAYGGPF